MNKLKIFEDLSYQVNNCKLCDLYKSATNSVMYRGNSNTKVAFVGESPGQTEDQLAKPFVGRSGKLLDNMIKSMNLSPEEDVFIANICKHRPPNNRKPTRKEMDACLPFLEKQLEVVSPGVIVTLGATATEGLLGGMGIVKRRGVWGKYKEIPVMPTYHPAALLRNSALKIDTWLDLRAVMKFLKENEK
jgi:DNA polymerase